MPGVEAMAQLVADRVSGQLPQLDELRAEERKRFDELHELVEGFLSERREGDQQTATVLDTMQQSIMRLLDRMDAVESATSHATASASTFEEDAPRATGLREQAATPGSGRQGTHAEQDVQRQSAGREQRYDPAIYQMYPEPSAGGPGNQTRAEPFAARSTRSRTEDAMPSSWHGERLGFVPPRQSPEDVVAVARRALRQAAQAAAEAGEEATVSQATQTEAQARKPAATHRSGTVARTWLPSRLVIATIVLIAVGATFTIATILRKTVVGDTIERMLLTPEPDEHDANGRLQNGKQDAGSRGLGGEFDKAGEGTQEPGSGSDRAPSLKQRTGEPPQNMHASTSDEGRLPQPQLDLDTAEANAGGDLRQSRVPETDGPDPARSLPATAVANLPDGISLQETGSIIGAAQLLQLQHLQHTASLSSRLGAAQVPAPALPTALTPDGAASGPDAAAKDAGLPSGARSHSILPPAAVGPQSLRVAAANGDPSAEFEVGTRLSEGRGLPQDLEQAAVWYQRAATRGFAPAQYRLATLHELGLGVPTDLARARVWYLRAAEQGHAKAMHNIAVMSASGRPGAPDYAAAIDWFTKAAERGLTDSQYNLGVLYESGLGVPRDPKEAYRWFALAAQAGDQEAARRRDMLRPRLAAAELQAADREVQSWRATPVDTLINDPRAAGEAWKQGNPAGRAE
jgi:localization factor PodJL